MTGVAVVTDSTSYLPPDLRAAAGAHVVSLYVTDDGAQRREADIDDYGAFSARLRDASALPTTSQPSVGDFAAVYEPLLAAGRDVVSIHLSGGISGTVEGARQGGGAPGGRPPRPRVEGGGSAGGAGGRGPGVVPAAPPPRPGGGGGGGGPPGPGGGGGGR